MRWFSSWFVRTPEIPKDPEKKKEFIGFLMDLVLAFIFGVVEMPILWRWAGWFLCFCILIFIVQSSVGRIYEYPRKTRILGGMIAAGIFLGVVFPTARDAWKEERALAPEGDLLGGPAESFNDGKQRMAPEVEIADSGSIQIMIPKPGPPEPYLKPFPDAEFRVEYGKKGPMVSTTIRDAEGHIVATVEKNHWTVYQQFCVDKNYTDDSLEILDSSRHVVLQLRILPDRVRVQGEWWDNQGHGLRIVKGADGHAYSALLGPQIKKNELLIKPVFMYPSRYHWRELIP